MTLTLDLSPELENRISQEAQRSGVSTEQFVVQILEDNLPPNDSCEKAIQLLQL